MPAPKLTDTDRFIFENEIKPFLPAKIFDAHSHVQWPRFHPGLEEMLPITRDPLFNTVEMRDLEAWWEVLFAGCETTGLILATPTEGCDLLGINENMAREVDPAKYRFSILTAPQFSTDDLESQIIRLKPHGLKPYMCFSPLHNDAGICDMIPESQIALAEKYGLAVTLHVAKPRGMADTHNLAEIARLVRTYRRCNFILAHCGRCFISPNMADTLKSLPSAPNLWIDTSAVCDPAVFLYLLSGFDKKQILFGTDLVMASGFRGTYIRMGMSWEWLLESSLKRPTGMPVRATFAAYENLCAMLAAARFTNTSKKDLEDIFYNNAARLFRL
jgi:predicted TIM-barrel fold metal-dependent hydrolase